jgi:hypothetical protein
MPTEERKYHPSIQPYMVILLSSLNKNIQQYNIHTRFNLYINVD